MSKTICDHEDFSLTEFFGGVNRGRCFQITTPTGYVQLTQADAFHLGEVLMVLQKEQAMKDMLGGEHG